MKLRQIFCWHDWRGVRFFIYNDNLEIITKNKIKQKWLLETTMFMNSIGASDIWPYFFRECTKCGKQDLIGISSLIEVTFDDYLLEDEQKKFYKQLKEMKDEKDTKKNY